MSGDMVASLTLRLQDQMSGGVGEIRALFTNLNATLEGLNNTLLGMQDLMANLRGPTQLMSDLQAVNSQAKAAADTMTASLDSVSAGVDADIVKIKEMYAAMGQGLAFIPPGVTAPGSFDPMAPLPPGMVPGAPEPTEPGAKPQPETKALGGSDMVTDMIAVATGYSAFKSFADFDVAAKQIAITEGLSGPAAMAESARLKGLTDHLAIQFGNSSTDLMSAFSFLITDSIPKDEVNKLMAPLAEASTAYNVPVSEMSQAVFTLYKNLGIGPDQMGRGLAILHHAAMAGHFGMEDFSMYLPQIGGQMSLMGMQGLGADITGASALETIRKNTGTSGEAATDLQDMLFYLHSPMGLRMFDQTKHMRDLLGPSGEALLNKYHVKPIDLPKYLNDERAKGIDPINAMADYFTKLLANVSSPTDRADIVGSMIHNQGAQNAILALVQYDQDFKNYQKKLGGISDKTITDDFYTAVSGTSADLKLFDENLAQASRNVGHAFDYFIAQPFNHVFNPGFRYGPDAPPGTPKPTPVELHVHVYGKGDVRVTEGPSSGPPARGQVLNRH